MAQPDELQIATRGPLNATVRVPGSKSYSNRALLVAALAEGTSQLSGVLDSDDTRVMATALSAMGAPVHIGSDARWSVEGCAGRLRVPTQVLDVHASGTAARCLTAAMALVPGDVRLDGTTGLRERPIADLTDALTSLGVDVRPEGSGAKHVGCPPVIGRATMRSSRTRRPRRTSSAPLP